jgi:DNA-binding XRE family transcriptional regulator
MTPLYAPSAARGRARSERSEAAARPPLGRRPRHTGGDSMTVSVTVVSERTVEGFVTRLRTIRHRRGLTQGELAKVVDISNRVIAYYEAQDAQPPRDSWPRSPAHSRCRPTSCSASSRSGTIRPRAPPVCSSRSGKSSSSPPPISAPSSNLWMRSLQLGAAGERHKALSPTEWSGSVSREHGRIPILACPQLTESTLQLALRQREQCPARLTAADASIPPYATGQEPHSQSENSARSDQDAVQTAAPRLPRLER